MMRKSILDINKENYNPDYEMAEDYYLWSRLIRYTKIANLQEVLVRYRMDVGMSFSSRDKMISQTHRIQQEMLNYLTTDKHLQNKIKTLLNCHKQKNSFKRHAKYSIYKSLWILGGKSNFYKAKMKKAERKMKGL